MNLLTEIFLIFFLMISFEPASAQDCKAKLNIKSDIEDVYIFIDDSLQGGGANFQAEIEPGNYVVKVVENSKKWNSKSFTDKIKVTDCSEIKLNYIFRNEILLDTDPQNAYVFCNDSLIGFTPLFINPNFESLVLEKPDYISKKITLSDLNPTARVQLEFIGEEKNENFFESTLFKVLVGTAVALGTTAAYFKLEADDRFEEYKIAGNPELLSQTDRLDIISGVAFVSLQINFGLIIYLFLSD